VTLSLTLDDLETLAELARLAQGELTRAETAGLLRLALNYETAFEVMRVGTLALDLLPPSERKKLVAELRGLAAGKLWPEGER